jgi:hypothetical protein
VLVTCEASTRELGVGRVEGRAEGVEVLLVGGAVAVADRFRRSEVGAAPAWSVVSRPVVLGCCAACARPWPSRPDAARRQSAPRAAEGRTAASALNCSRAFRIIVSEMNLCVKTGPPS